ncbi:type I restriction endonuclease [Thiocapsa marina]|uniref:Restriction endonuclease, type I, EcoRI, R subunit/Type III n=1 Tax=Thiocapsa marina 5811 TaxID=768671 RepID=F9U8Q8_9GAMM|nr:type I restriction endonuclease [Thiocapsa marina]EGV19166.1 Restriction endonuclease, type I, EcoRI, R subunit/Type III [Thiocapsa marina 5811]
MTTDTTERGLERLICAAMTGSPCEPGALTHGPLDEPHADYGVGWMCGRAADYDREYCVDLTQLAAFLHETQLEVAAALDLHEDGPTRRKFLARIQGEITRRGTIDVLRHGIKHGPHHVDLFYGTPSPGNARAAERNKANRFSVTRQLRYSRDETQLALDLCLFINGLPVASFELKNSLPKQTVEDAVQQYKLDRDPRERLFELGRCVVHFTVDDHEVRFCTQLKGKASWFLPFNLGWNDGAGNPPNPNGLKTDYLWRRILTPAGLTDILENYAQVVEIKNEKTGRKKTVQIWPRYLQLDVVRKLLADAAQNGAGRRYLIQHSAGSGKSNSIAWLAHQLIGLEQDGVPMFDSIIVVTDRRILDQQIKDTIKQFANDSDAIQQAFSAYYRTTILAEETDPDKLHDLKAALDGYQVYMSEQIEDLVQRSLGGAERDALDPILEPAWPSTETSSTRTARSTSKARPKRSCGSTASSPRSCPTPTPTGRSSRSSSPFTLNPAVERPLECVPRGVRQGATRRRSGSTPTRCNAAGRRAGRAPGGVAAVTRRVSSRTTTIFKAVKALHEARSGQLPDLGSRAQAARPRGGGPRQGHPRSDRHGQLPGREAGGSEDPAPRCGHGDRAGADHRGRPQARAEFGSALEHPQDLRRPVRPDLRARRSLSARVLGVHGQNACALRRLNAESSGKNGGDYSEGFL